MTYFGRCIVLIVLFCISQTALAKSDKRVALVIGNAAYQNTATLRNPRNDAEDMAAALKRLKFEVITGSDLDKREMERLIRHFGVSLLGAEVALFFYAGHGVQVGAQNYLLPTDARLSTEGDVDFESLSLELVLKQMMLGAKTSLLLLDACRDNPLARNLARSMGTRSGQIGQGLAEVKTGVGTLISFSTQPGNVALDGSGRNSPYAAALIKHIEAPGKDITATLINVRSDVIKATNSRQVPWEHTSLLSEIVLSSPPSLSERAKSLYDKDMEIAFWTSAKESLSPDALRAYIGRFPEGTFVGLARVLIDQAEKQRATQLEVSRREEELKRAEEFRSAAEQQKREAERKAAEAKYAEELRKAQAEARKARDALLIAEKEREAAIKAAESARKAQEEAKEATETVVASLPKSQQHDASPPDNTSLTKSIQRELARIGCHPGEEDGKWGPAVRGAIEKFNRLVKGSLASDTPTSDALANLAVVTKRVCRIDCAAGEKDVGGRCVKETAARKPTVQANDAATRQQPQPGGSSYESCVKCCSQTVTFFAGGGCIGLCSSRDDRIRACLR